MNYINQILSQCKFVFFFEKLSWALFVFWVFRFIPTPPPPHSILKEVQITDLPLPIVISFVITGRNEVVGQGNIFYICLSFILFTGGVCLSACWDTTPPGPATPPRTRHPPGPATHPPDQAPPRPGTPLSPVSWLQHTVYERPVRILLECILVFLNFQSCFSVITQSLADLAFFVLKLNISQLTLAKLAQLSRHENL